MIRVDIFDEKLDELDRKVTEYVNKNVKEIIKVAIDFLEDDNDFSIWDIVPRYKTSISEQAWRQMMYDLYNLVSSTTLRDYVKPKYEYLLYLVLCWWQECFEEDMELLPIEIDDILVQKINTKYSSDDGVNSVLHSITTFEEYYYILFADHDFLPDSLEKMVIIYLKSKEMFQICFPDVELEEYRDLMPVDLREQYDESRENSSDEARNIEENIYKDIFFCCEKVQADISLKNALENTINDTIRNLLDAKGYDVKDQTRHGASATGKQAGNVDLLVKVGQYPVTLIEALRLEEVSKKYILEHVNRIYKYDTLGLKYNFLISYVKTKDFQDFCHRYIDYIKDMKYPYDVKRWMIWDSKQYSEIRTIEMILDREGIETKLYHMVIHMPE